MHTGGWRQASKEGKDRGRRERRKEEEIKEGEERKEGKEEQEGKGVSCVCREMATLFDKLTG